MVSRVLIADGAPTITFVCIATALLMLSSSSVAADLSQDEYVRTPHASFQRSDAMDFEEPQDDWSAGLEKTEQAATDADDSWVVLERPTALGDRDSFGMSHERVTFRLTDYALSIDMIRLGEALEATARWYRRPRKVAPDAELVLDSFYDIGREVVDEGLVLVRSRSEQKGLQAKLGASDFRIRSGVSLP